ncbi:MULTISPECIES: GNAT family N-acetyltransferase [unclassified Bradyrhizobium]|uniref:GNAT family N-acetyltransferase n=1 Tax=unclassified Bradyrhizobium TaxID=2631580 RepID=UPI0020B26216|nr:MULTISPECIES: GNAT family N-acetyltransferase [unclassified Bradyrhizobium]MCP3397090.1 GNAT family N-acetyltransferase [Bradyrhizobium sp. CCGB20]MCP3405602.1 GNAT family N-acetyltransferase [Bradyrhizobium sp. CCGB01]
MDEIVTRRVTAADAETVGRFVDSLLVELRGEPSDASRRINSARALLADSSNYLGFLAEKSAGPLGLMMIIEFAAVYTLGIAGTITELYVLPAYRSNGVAERLLGAAIAHGKMRGWNRLEVGAPRQPAWQRSLKFYKRNGFTEIGPRLGLKLG